MLAFCGYSMSPARKVGTSLLPQARLLEWVSREKFKEVPGEATPVAAHPPSLCLQIPTLGYYHLSVLQGNVLQC